MGTRKRGKRQKRRRDEKQEIAELERLLAAQKRVLLTAQGEAASLSAPKRGADGSGGEGEEEGGAAADAFSKLAVSRLTKKGLRDSGFEYLTGIQKASIPYGLIGMDILGAAKTGSGKTLAFLVPLVENLYRAQWSRESGTGALVISPTRELALQIFDVLQKIAQHHNLTAGLIIGGKSFEEEQAFILRLNILVCTPGRLLQHMDQTYGFDCNGLRVLVLDEADRLLDMGFERVVNSILENLPKQRQTFLFSATQTRDVKQLARLSLNEKSLKYISVDADSDLKTPAGLKQWVMPCKLQQKFDILFSFLRSHLHSKMLVFLSSCKQVRFWGEVLRRLRPGIPVSALHGKLAQKKRMALYYRFCESKEACMLCTDVAARGLDFPNVSWVIQMDCPDSPETYIHRVGRTARIGKKGNALLMLNESEMAMHEILSQHLGIELPIIYPNPKKLLSKQGAIQALLSESPDLKYLAQKAFVSYMRSVFLQSNKKVFDVRSLPYKELAYSMGLPGAPKIKFGKSKRTNKNLPFALQSELAKQGEDAAESNNNNNNNNKEAEGKEEDDYYLRLPGKQEPKSRVDRLLQRKPGLALKPERLALLESEQNGEEEEEEDWLQLARVDHDLEEDVAAATEGKTTTGSAGKSGRKIATQSLSELQEADMEEEGKKYQRKLQAELERADPLDKLRQKEMRKRKRRALKLKLKQMQQEAYARGGQVVAMLPEAEYEEEEYSEESSSSSDDGSSDDGGESSTKRAKTSASVKSLEEQALSLMGAVK